MKKEKFNHSEVKIRKAALKVVEELLKSGEDEIDIRPIKIDGKNEISISSPLNEEINWDILEKMTAISNDITWCVRKNDCDELCIVLINEEVTNEPEDKTSVASKAPQ